MALTKAHNRMIEGSVVNVRDFGAVGDGVTDDYAAIKAAIDSVGTTSTDGLTVYFPRGNYYVSQPIKMDKVGMQIVGETREETFIQQLSSGFTGASLTTHPGTIWVTAAQCMINNIFITGGRYTNSSDGIHIKTGQFLEINNVHVKFGERGIFLENGNSQRWFNVLVEACINGVVYSPSVTQDCNGGTIIALRCIANEEWGFRLEKGDVSVIPNGPRHNTIEVTSENNGQSGTAGGGIYIDKSSYNYLNIYAESQNFGPNYSVVPSDTANFMYVKNPDNDTRAALSLFQSTSYNIGVYTSGGSLYLDAGFAEERYVEQEFTASASLAGIGIKMYDVTNTSGAQRTMTLSFLSYSPIGFRTVITKRDNTSGFTLAAPAGITLTGDTGVFGAGVTSVKRLEVIKISASQAILIRSGA